MPLTYDEIIAEIERLRPILEERKRKYQSRTQEFEKTLALGQELVPEPGFEISPPDILPIPQEPIKGLPAEVEEVDVAGPPAPEPELEPIAIPEAPVPLELEPPVAEADITRVLPPEPEEFVDPERHAQGKGIESRMRETGKSAQELAWEDEGMTVPERGLSSRVYTAVTEPIGEFAGEKLLGLSPAELTAREYRSAINVARTEKGKGLAEISAEREEVARIEAGEYGLEAPPVTLAEPILETDMSSKELFGQKWKELKTDTKQLIKDVKDNWQTVKEEVVIGLAEDAPLLVLGMTALSATKKALLVGKTVQRARKQVELAKKIRGFSVDQKKAFIREMFPDAKDAMVRDLMAGNLMTTSRTAKALNAVSRFPERFPNLAKAAGYLAEVGIILTPSMIREEDWPSAEETLVAGGMVGLFRYIGGKIGRARRAGAEARGEPPEYIPPERLEAPRERLPVPAEPAVTPVAKKPPVPEFKVIKPSLAPKELPVKPTVQENVFVKTLTEEDRDIYGLANKKRMETVEIPQALKEDKYIIAFDVDFLKAVNAEFGHGSGNKIIQQMSNYFAASFPEGKLGRVGGDEFQGVFDVMPTQEELKKFITEFPNEVTIAGQPLTISAGMGIGKEGDNLYADILSNNAKNRGKNQIIVDIEGKQQYIKGQDVNQPFVDKYELKEFERLAKSISTKPESEILRPEYRSLAGGTLQQIRKIREAGIRRVEERVPKVPEEPKKPPIEKPPPKPPIGEKGAVVIPTVKELKEAVVRIKESVKPAKIRTPKAALPIYATWVREIQTRTFELARITNELVRMGSKVQREAVPFIIEGTEVPEKLNRPDIVPYLKDPVSLKMADKARDHFNTMWEYMVKHRDEMPENMIENYVTHLWDIPKNKRADVIKWFTTRNPQLMKRIIPTINEGIEKFGLTPKTLDIAELISIHGQNAIRTTENQILLKGLKELEDDAGQKLIMPTKDAPAHWVTIDHPALNRMSMFPTKKGEALILTKTPVKYHPDLAPLMRAVFSAPWRPEGLLGAGVAVWENANAILKQTNLAISFFHHIALAEAAVATMGPVKTAKIALDLKAMWRALNKKEFSMFMEKYEIAKDGIAHGVKFGANLDVQKHIVDKIIAVTGDFVEKEAGKLASKPLRGLGWAKEKWDQALWDYYHNNLKLMAYETLVSRELGKYAKELKPGVTLFTTTREDIKKMKEEIAAMVNDTFGGQNLQKQMADPNFMRAFRGAMLSPDWLVSTLKQAGAVIGIGAVRPELVTFRMKMASKFWLRAAIYFGGSSLLWNYLMTQKDDAEQRDVPFSEGKGKWMWQNDPGKETNIFWGRGPEDEKIYLRHGKQFREGPEYLYDAHAGEWSPITATLKKLGGKAAPVPQLISTIITGKALSGYEIRELRGKEGWEKVSAITKVLATSWLPFSFSALKDERKEFNPIQFAFPTSRGASQYSTRKYFKTALQKDDPKFIEKTWNAALENNIPEVYKLFNQAVNELRSDAQEEYRADLRREGVTDKQLEKIKTPADLKSATKEMKRLIKKKRALARQENLDDMLRRIEAYKKQKKAIEKEIPEEKLKPKLEKLKLYRELELTPK